MKEFCNIVHIYFKDQVEKIENGVVVPKAHQTPIVCLSDDFNIVPSTNDNKASLLTTVSQTLYIEKIPLENANKLRIKRSVIIQLNPDKDSLVIGSLEYPAQLIYTQTLNTGILKIEQKQPSYTI